MTHKKRPQSHRERPGSRHTGIDPPNRTEIPVLELVVKADTQGTLDAVISALDAIRTPLVAVGVVHTGIGNVAKSDLDMAVTANRLVLGFGVGLHPKVEELARGEGVEIRLYEVIYDLTRDVEEIARSLRPPEPQETVTGQARVIRLFKSTRKGIILGCEVQKGTLALGKRFRVITAMGPVYQGVVESLHIGDHAVREARVGQQVGVKIPDLKKAEVGDLVECFEPSPRGAASPWQPTGGVHGPPR